MFGDVQGIVFGKTMLYITQKDLKMLEFVSGKNYFISKQMEKDHAKE